MERLDIEYFDKAYAFTNENLAELTKIIDFKDKKVLSVIGSGDQYFSSLLYGAKDIDLFDNNLTAVYYFYFKYYAIMLLSYEEFIDSFIFYNHNYYNKIRDYLPLEVKEFFDEFLKNRELCTMLHSSTALKNKEMPNNRVIPYLDKEHYYELQDLLRNSKIPNILCEDILILYKFLNDTYDVMLFSNIYAYLKMTVKKYRHFLKKYEKYLNKNGVIEANYEWFCFDSDFKKYGFKSHLVLTAFDKYANTDMQDNILTLKRSH